MTNTDGLSDLHEEIKILEKWLNQSLGEKKAILKDLDVQNKNELYAAAEKIQVTIKKKRIVTEHKILAGLTQWTKIEQEGHQYGYLLTGLICEMLKELINLPNSSSKDNTKYKKNALYTTNFTEPLSYQDSAFLKLPKFP